MKMNKKEIEERVVKWKKISREAWIRTQMATPYERRPYTKIKRLNIAAPA